VKHARGLSATAKLFVRLSRGTAV